MADEIPQTPVPVPTYGQPQSVALQNQPGEPSAIPEVQNVAIAPTTESGTKDVVMTDGSSADLTFSPAPAAPSTNAPSPAPVRTGTPLRTNGQENTSRAASQHPDPAFTMPDAVPAHGAPVRQYLNSKVTAHLLEGMKQLAKDQPKDPLRVLGEFLIERSKEFET
ncbi:hypothetical protein F5X97DRAFT_321290 [Nemania serpens]|nr:hypothetical protein F5X97DRAFT_321290 [Nemania serpens]